MLVEWLVSFRFIGSFLQMPMPEWRRLRHSGYMLYNIGQSGDWVDACSHSDVQWESGLQFRVPSYKKD